MTPRGHPPGAAGGVVMKGYMNERSKSQKANDRRRKYIKQLKDEAGGKCAICGYDRCFNALIFHHRDPKTKEFELSGDETKGMGWNKLKKEADKCILMCNRCHTEFHSGMITIDGQYSKEALDNMARYFSDTV
jgi:hypothetical protein